MWTLKPRHFVPHGCKRQFAKKAGVGFHCVFTGLSILHLFAIIDVLVSVPPSHFKVQCVKCGMMYWLKLNMLLNMKYKWIITVNWSYILRTVLPKRGSCLQVVAILQGSQCGHSSLRAHFLFAVVASSHKSNGITNYWCWSAMECFVHPRQWNAELPWFLFAIVTDAMPIKLLLLLHSRGTSTGIFCSRCSEGGDRQFLD